MIATCTAMLHRRQRGLVACVLAVFGAFVFGAISANAGEGLSLPAGWGVYANARFSYEICYPAELMTAQPEADNGDGRAFVASSGAVLRVWGSYNAAEQSLSEITDSLARQLTDRGGRVSYRHTAKGWAVISGADAEEVFYAKVLLEKDVVRAFALTYPRKQSGTFDTVASRLAGCFRAMNISSGN